MEVVAQCRIESLYNDVCDIVSRLEFQDVLGEGLVWRCVGAGVR